MAGTLAEIDEKIAKISEEAEEERKAEADKPVEEKMAEEKKAASELPSPTPKVGQVLTECPNCRKKQRHGDEFGIVATRYLVFMGPNQPPVVSLLKIACPFCGVESFRGKDLAALREKAKESKNLVVVPQAPPVGGPQRKDN